VTSFPDPPLPQIHRGFSLLRTPLGAPWVKIGPFYLLIFLILKNFFALYWFTLQNTIMALIILNLWNVGYVKSNGWCFPLQLMSKGEIYRIISIRIMIITATRTNILTKYRNMAPQIPEAVKTFAHSIYVRFHSGYHAPNT